MTLNQKLATIQTKFKSKKSRFNSFGKYYFRSAEDILEATKPYLLELGVTVTINENLVETSPVPIIKYALGNLFLIDDTKDADATNGLPMNKAAIQKAKDFVQAGGKLDAIKKKYNVTPEIEKQITL